MMKALTSRELFPSIDGDARLSRRFFINRDINGGGCDNEAGWLVVYDQPPRPACPWEMAPAYPLIKFSASPRAESYRHREVLEADALAIFLKYNKQL
ncbi:hypothetical protein ElyMa_006607000 [Elysia marginata]|uniref:Uncharacterized protein n=1 Tax=Elysia marginata TaxID=1093978 RepID=A0AAV4IG36_9GAST|nr:hypothetical protein ElyMa_006607000 [Elysia marginata]